MNIKFYYYYFLFVINLKTVIIHFENISYVFSNMILNVYYEPSKLKYSTIRLKQPFNTTNI